MTDVSVAGALLGVVLAMASACRRPPAEAVSAKVDTLFAPWSQPGSPGCAVGVARNGALLYEQGYGLANLELGVRIAPSSVFSAASISKQFTAMSVVLLAERGRLSLDDDVRRFLPEWADHEHHVTIRQLLTHTSGLREGFALLGWAMPSDGSVSTNEAMVPMLARQRGLNFTPGTAYQYNNGAYNLLGTIVKRASGETLGSFAAANIFKPLGMTHTRYRDDPDVIIADRASGYTQDASGFRQASEAVGVVGNAGVYTTVGDLLRWEHNFADVRVGTRADIAAMQAPTTLAGGGTSQYGFGLAIGEYRGLRTVEHAGSDRGAVANAVRYPDRQLAVVVLCNLDTIDVNSLTHAVTDLYLADVLAPNLGAAASAAGRISVSADQLAGSSGVYRSTANADRVIRVSVRNGALVVRSFFGDDVDLELIPLSADRFLLPGSTNALEFVPAANGHPRRWRLIDHDGHELGGFALVTFEPAAADLRSAAGAYRSAELDVTYTVGVESGGLVIHPPGRAAIALQSIEKDVFAGDSVGTVKFTRDAGGGLSGFSVNRDNARGVRFERTSASVRP